MGVIRAVDGCPILAPHLPPAKVSVANGCYIGTILYTLDCTFEIFGVKLPHLLELLKRVMVEFLPGPNEPNRGAFMGKVRPVVRLP